MSHCPWCNTETENKVLELKDYFLSKETFNILECPKCHLRFTDPRPAPDKLGEYYRSDKYYSHQEGGKGLVARLYSMVKTVNLKAKFRVATKGLARGKVLDIGCGIGDFLLKSKQNGWEVRGIEPDPHARQLASAKLHVPILHPDAINELPDASFDLITMWHVLEHVDDLEAQIKQLHRLLKPNGRLVIAVPNFESDDAKHYGAKWAAWDVPRHLNHFCINSMRTIFSNSSFVLDAVSGQKWDAYYIAFMSEQYGNKSIPLLRGFVHGLQSNLKACRSGVYSSLVYVFSKC